MLEKKLLQVGEGRGRRWGLQIDGEVARRLLVFQNVGHVQGHVARSPCLDGRQDTGEVGAGPGLLGVVGGDQLSLQEGRDARLQLWGQLCDLLRGYACLYLILSQK